MSKANFHQMRAQGHDVDDSGNMFNEQAVRFGCRVKPMTKEEIEEKYGNEKK